MWKICCPRPGQTEIQVSFFPLPSYVIFILAITFCPQTQGGRANVAYFAGGCYWFTEAVFQQVPGVPSVKSGYMRNTETIEVTFDPAKTSYDKLLDLFWRAHDPAEIDRQGPGYREEISLCHLLRGRSATRRNRRSLVSGFRRLMANGILRMSKE